MTDNLLKKTFFRWADWDSKQNEKGFAAATSQTLKKKNILP